MKSPVFSQALSIKSFVFKIFAWKIADQLLHVKKDMESCYFGAQTLRTKIQFAFHELPPEAHNSLRDSMLDHLTQINEHTNTVIVTQVI